MKTDVLVIGSSAGGVVAATTGKRLNPDKKFTVVTMMPKTLIPCGIPYVFGTVGSTEKNILPADKMLGSMGIELIFDEVVSIDKKNKFAKLKNGKEISFEKLIFATGSLPILPKWLKGATLDNVFTIPKNKVYLDEMQKKLEGCKKVITIGAGFIGVEISDELHKAGKEVILVEKLPYILARAFDEDIALRINDILIERGIQVKANVGIKEIIGTDKVEGVLLENGERIAADAVVLAMGYSPNTKLAIDTGVVVDDRGAIKVDEYMHTDNHDIFAVGDCAEKKDFITRRSSPAMLASTACAEARIAGMNLFKLSAIKTFSGTISIFATAIGNQGFGVAGLTERAAIEENFNYTTGIFEGMDRHPGVLKDAHKQFVKLIIAKGSGVILGGEVAGGLSVGELTNTLGIMIQNRMTLNSLLTAQIGTHPLLTASPAGYPLIKAAENACGKMGR